MLTKRSPIPWKLRRKRQSAWQKRLALQKDDWRNIAITLIDLGTKRIAHPLRRRKGLLDTDFAVTVPKMRP
jgi:hypothetical protein